MLPTSEFLFWFRASWVISCHARFVYFTLVINRKFEKSFGKEFVILMVNSTRPNVPTFKLYVANIWHSSEVVDGWFPGVQLVVEL